MNHYPSPCDKCTKTTCDQLDCEAWARRFRTLWKQINGYPARAYRTGQVRKTEKFAYEHPDIVRRYLKTGPCGKCQRGKVCETPCPAYWHWWDARMEWLRGRFGV